MGKLITLALVGLALVLLGITNLKGNLSSIHWYNRRNVTEADLPRYGACMGSGTLIIGGSFILSALLEGLMNTDVFDTLLLAGCVIGVIVMLYSQFKYNKGIF